MRCQRHVVWLTSRLPVPKTCCGSRGLIGRARRKNPRKCRCFWKKWSSTKTSTAWTRKHIGPPNSLTKIRGVPEHWLHSGHTIPWMVHSITEWMPAMTDDCQNLQKTRCQFVAPIHVVPCMNEPLREYRKLTQRKHS